MAEMSFEQIKERLDFFEKTFKNATKSLKEFIKELEGGESTRFQAWVDQLDLMQKTAINAKKEMDIIVKNLKNVDREIAQMEKSLRKMGVTEEYIQMYLQDHIDSRNILLEQIEKHKQSIAEVAHEQDKLNNLVKLTINSTDKFLERIKIKNYHDSVFYKMMKSFGGGKKDIDNLTIAFKSMFGRLRDLLEPLNLVSNLFVQISKATYTMVMSLSDTLASFAKNTGIVGVYDDVLWDSYQTNLKYSVSLEKIKEATQDLNKDMQSFHLMSMESRKQLIDMVSLYDKFGASTHELSEFFGKMTDTFKMSADASQVLMGELRGLHANIGGPWRVIVDNFNDHLQRLARFGVEGAKKAFKELSVISKSLRIEFSELFKVTDQFDTYETAAKAVGRFNAIAGGPYLNTISLMKQSEDERAKSIIQAIKQSKINYEILSAQEKQALANSIGITDMTTAQKIFTGSLADYYKLRAITNEKEEEAAKKAKNIASITDKLNTIFESLAVIVEPILWVVSNFLSMIRDIVQVFTTGWEGALLSGITLLTYFVAKTILATGATAAMGVDLTLTGGAGLTASGGLSSAAASTAALGTASTVTAPKVGFLGRILGGMLKMLGSVGSMAWEAIPGIIGLGLAIGIVAGVTWLLAKALKAISDIFSDDPISSDQAAIIERMSKIPSGSSEKIDALAKSVENLSSSVNDLDYDNLEKLLDILDDVSKKTKNLSSEATISITRNIADLFESAGKVTTSNTTEIRNIVNEIVRIGTETDATKVQAAKEFAGSISKNSSANTTGGGQPVINVIELNGREMARWFSQQLDSLKFDITKQKQK